MGDSVDDAIRESEYFDLSTKYSLSQKTSLNQKIKTLILFLKKKSREKGLGKSKHQEYCPNDANVRFDILLV